MGAGGSGTSVGGRDGVRDPVWCLGEPAAQVRDGLDRLDRLDRPLQAPIGPYRPQFSKSSSGG
jgi:hypothetical protein